MPDIACVIPVFNEVNTVESLVHKILEVSQHHHLGTCEIIFVDDGSTDGSWGKIKQLAHLNPQVVRGLRLRRNFGKATALAHGFESVQAPIVFTLDADFQDDPSQMPKLLAKLHAGFDVVTGWKQERKDPWIKVSLSRLFNQVVQRLTGVPLRDLNSGFKVYKKEVLSELPLYGELHRFIPIMAHHAGFKVSEVPVEHLPRQFGHSKYGWDRGFKGCLDLLTILATTRFGQRPLHLFGGGGLFVGGLGIGVLTYLSIKKLFWGDIIGGRPLFFLGILGAVMGAQMVFFGVLAELIQRSDWQGPLTNRIAARTDTAEPSNERLN
ncbi:MAG: hypothetical protein B7X06_00655 [Verrucomicrobia bacterium 21-51-4]|nr:MAG: hypothetical protein B7X06_00655 [Verrucomicrobia bacterium 21-51-4]HQU08642.1 glycosyltransferase family 2 protein [Opitutales bacterium]